MTIELPRACDISPDVERQLAYELSAQCFIDIDPEIALISPFCGLASHSLAQFLGKKRGYEIYPYIGSIPLITKLDGGFDYQHVLIRDTTKGTVIDPTPLQVLEFAGYSYDYIYQHFPQPPESLIGDVRIVEFPDSAEGARVFAGQMTDIAMTVRQEALSVRDKLISYGGLPFLDIERDEIYNIMVDMWDLAHYRPYPEEPLNDDFKVQIAYIAHALVELDTQSV